MVISTGRIVSWPCVRALNSLQKAMMLIPWGPRAVPTGGAGFALPAGICSLTKPTAFFAMILLSYCQPSSSVGAAYDSHGLISVVVVSDGALLASSAAPRKGHHLRREKRRRDSRTSPHFARGALDPPPSILNPPEFRGGLLWSPSK